MYFTDRGIEELEDRRGEEEVSLAWLADRLRAFVDAHPESVQRFDAKGWKVPGGTPSSPSLAAVLPSFPANLVKQLKGAHYPAQHHILCAAVESLNVSNAAAIALYEAARKQAG